MTERCRDAGLAIACTAGLFLLVPWVAWAPWHEPEPAETTVPGALPPVVWLDPLEEPEVPLDPIPPAEEPAFDDSREPVQPPDDEASPAEVPDLRGLVPASSWSLPSLPGVALPSPDVVMSSPRGASALFDTPARPLSRLQPAYPPAARLRSQQGSVLIEFTVQPDGRTGRVEILESDPPGVFDQAARQAVEQWRFTPAQRGGRPLPVRLRQRIRFETSAPSTR